MNKIRIFTVMFLCSFFLIQHEYSRTTELGTPVTTNNIIEQMTMPELAEAQELELIKQKAVKAVKTVSIHDLVNYERISRGLNALKIDSRLQASTKAKCKDMIDNNYWWHERVGKTWDEFIVAEGIYNVLIGENLAKDFKTNEQVVTAWMNSPKHRDNMLGDFTIVGYAYCPNTNNWIVQHFGN